MYEGSTPSLGIIFSTLTKAKTMWPFKKKAKKIPVTTSSKDGERLTEWELSIIREAKCPDCKSGLLGGPRGPGAQNIYCENDEGCGSRFNYMWELGGQRITDRQPNKDRICSLT